MTKIKWTPEIQDAFETLLGREENLTYAEIARRMSAQFGLAFTKNACIGQAYRTRQPQRPPKRQPRRKVIPMPDRIDAPILPKEARRLPGNRNLNILQLEYGVCKWPEGTNPPYVYCGHPTRDGASFCPEHRNIVYQTAKKHWE
jgi:hypothetical protein